MKRFIAVIILLCVAVAVPLSAPAGVPRTAQRSRPFESQSQFLYASETTVHTRLGARPLDSAKKMDKVVIDLLKELDAINTMSTKLYWADGKGSSAHPQAGIGLDRVQVTGLQDELSLDKFREVIKFVLAHEQAHMAQFRRYSLESMSDAAKRRAIECQADILGGYSVSLSLLFEGKQPAYSNDAIALWARLGEKLGSPEWDDQSKHPRPEQRMRAISLGLNAGLYHTWVNNYKRTKDPRLLKEIQDWRSRVPDLFEIDEDLFNWSNRVAKQIVRYGQ